MGKIVETGDEYQVYDNTAHPYTTALLSAVPIPDPAKRDPARRILLEGDVPSPANPPSGCRFRTRCPLYALLDDASQQVCRGSDPELTRHGRASVACHHADRSALMDRAALGRAG